jgi:hypothetical protein
MKRYNNKLIFILSGAIILFSGTAKAQKDTTRLRKEVEVVKAYQPSISDAFKINDIPQIKDEPSEKPTFNYSIYSKPVFSSFDLTPVQAARIVGDTNSQLERGLLKGGFGNHQTAYGELFFNAQPDTKSNFGLHLKHLSSGGSVKLINDDKVDAPESLNAGDLFLKNFFRSSTLTTTIGFRRDAFRYYGYAGDAIPDSLKGHILYQGEKQSFLQGNFGLNLKNDRTSGDLMNYNLGLNYQYFGTRTGQKEHLAKFQAWLDKKYNQTNGILEAGLTYYKVDSILNGVTGFFGSRQQIVLKANPSLMWKDKNYLLQIGLNSDIVFDDDDKAKLYASPKLQAEWSPVVGVLTLYAGVDGYMQHNTYSAIARENQFANWFHDVKNSEVPYVLSGGFKGKFSPKTNYVAGVSYAAIKNQHFYYLNSTNRFIEPATSDFSMNNTFDCLYDDVKQLTLSGEIYHAASSNLTFHLKGNYYSYEMKTLEQPWQMPEFDATISTIFNTDGPLQFTADIFVIGERKGLIRDQNTTIITLTGEPSYSYNYFTLDPIIDMNVGAEYRFSKNLSFWGKLNNFAFQKYEQWLGYANRGLNVLVGASYSF